MNAINKIRERLTKYPSVRYEATDHSVTVYPMDDRGFVVKLLIHEGDHYIYFNGWHSDFWSDEEETLEYFAFGLSTDCRLKEERRGTFAYRWTVEVQRGGRWVDEGTTGLFFYPFWRKKEVRYLQNSLIASNDSEENGAS